MGSVNASFIVIALPTLSRYFNAGASIVSWMILVYFLVITAFLLTFGRLGDHVGYRHLYTTGLVVFTVGSLLCGLSWSIWYLIGFRIIQGIGAALLIALSPAIISAFLPESVRGRAFGYIGSVNAVGLAGGLAMGGLCCDFASWRLAFLFNVPIGVAAFLLARSFLPFNSVSSRKPGFDLPGSVLIFAAFFIREQNQKAPLQDRLLFAPAIFDLLSVQPSLSERCCQAPSYPVPSRVCHGILDELLRHADDGPGAPRYRADGRYALRQDRIPDALLAIAVG